MIGRKSGPEKILITFERKKNEELEKKTILHLKYAVENYNRKLML